MYRCNATQKVADNLLLISAFHISCFINQKPQNYYLTSIIFILCALKYPPNNPILIQLLISCDVDSIVIIYNKMPNHLPSQTRGPPLSPSQRPAPPLFLKQIMFFLSWVLNPWHTDLDWTAITLSWCNLELVLLSCVSPIHNKSLNNS